MANTGFSFCSSVILSPISYVFVFALYIISNPVVILIELIRFTMVSNQRLPLHILGNIEEQSMSYFILFECSWWKV